MAIGLPSSSKPQPLMCVQTAVGCSSLKTFKAEPISDRRTGPMVKPLASWRSSW